MCLKTPPSFDKTISVFRYDYPLNHLIQQYKYQEALHISQFFAANLLETLGQNTEFATNEMRHVALDLVIPMPIYNSRLQTRGFNQSLEIARILSTRLNVPLD